MKNYILVAMRPHLIRLFGAQNTVPILMLLTKFIDDEIDRELFYKSFAELNIKNEQPTDVISLTLIKAVYRLKKFYQASIAGVKYFEHVGLSMTTDTKQCQQRMNKTYPLGKIEKMDAGGMGPAKIFGCGWTSNCYWEPDPFRK